MIIRIGTKKIKPMFVVKEAMPMQKISWKKKPYYVLVLRGILDIGEKTKGDISLYSSTLGPFFMYKTPASYGFSSRSPINNLLKMTKVAHYDGLSGLKLPLTTEGKGWLIDLK